ncbi:MAG: phosphodiester glycosidase family protein [Gemmatimonadales bacterium]
MRLESRVALSRAVVLGIALAGAAAGAAAQVAAPLPPSSLAWQEGGRWVEWWSAARAPARWDSAGAILARRVPWLRSASGVEWGEVALAGSGEAWRTRVIAVRIDPQRVRISLDTAFVRGRAAWTLDHADTAALVAFNAGQFSTTMPWGWVVLGGRDFLSSASAPLAATIIVTTGGAVHWSSGRAIPSVPREQVAWAFQSYPLLLSEGDVPRPLREAGLGVDVAHRDARLALGVSWNGELIVALTRFDAIGPAFDRVPFGLTAPEMAAVMGALGARNATLLDGGISAQLLVRGAAGEHRWPGSRAVPLALVVHTAPTR